MMQNIPHDRVKIRDYETGLILAVTSSRPIKATNKDLKITAFFLPNLPEGREIEYNVRK